jgi:A/G-specific adenine glycosylase
MQMDAIVDWFEASHRALPWREPDTTPWGILVSEVMLQQTPVPRVTPLWEAWLRHWPTPKLCAQAPLSEVITLWGRLGYPRRAKRLHEAARAIVDRHGGELPQELEALLALPGVGDYTARAIRCFAFGFPDPVVDTNVRRVLARLVAGDGHAGPPRTAHDLRSAEEALERVSGVGGKVTLAKGLMELGAVVCTARAPLCAHCPVAASCEWKNRGYPEYAGKKALPQAQYEGSDRQARGVILRELRSSDTPIPGSFLQSLSTDQSQYLRALASLTTDGLIAESPEYPGHYELGS